jgi:hypothetical protein
MSEKANVLAWEGTLRLADGRALGEEVQARVKVDLDTLAAARDVIERDDAIVITYQKGEARLAASPHRIDVVSVFEALVRSAGREPSPIVVGPSRVRAFEKRLVALEQRAEAFSRDIATALSRLDQVQADVRRLDPLTAFGALGRASEVPHRQTIPTTVTPNADEQKGEVGDATR